jgi:DUF1365 family protein
MALRGSAAPTLDASKNRTPSLLVGHVRHRRLRPVSNDFEYPVFFLQLPLQNLEAAQLPVFSINRLNVMGFYASDHGARDGSSLISWVRALLRERGLPDDGEVVLQTFPRVLGFAFNPVSFWFCYDCLDHLVAVLAEVNNTFGGHHNYLLHNPDGSPLIDGQEFCSDKVFHVSPFCLVRGVYHFRFYLDGAVQKASIEYDDSDGKSLILTSISGRKRSWSNWDLIKVFLLMPFLTLGIVWRIHWQALRLWSKKVPFYGASPPPPNHLSKSSHSTAGTSFSSNN